MWIAGWTIVLALAATGLLLCARARGFVRTVEREAAAMFARGRRAAPLDRRRLARLPVPVARYLTRALGDRRTPVRAVRLEHAGSFRMDLDRAPATVRGLQFFRADEPAFVWWGRVRLGPGLWLDARDRSVDGAGSMRLLAGATLPVVEAEGRRLDEGALLRLLAELPWFPTAFLDERHVSWEPFDGRSARATLTVGGRRVSGVFVFDGADLPVRFATHRYHESGDGEAEELPWIGEYGDFRRVDGMLVPFAVTASWIRDGRTIPCAEWVVERIAYDDDAVEGLLPGTHAAARPLEVVGARS